ncbi:ClC family H(+)/Cl(-) exchange transporter [Gordonia phosphorivorans]|uniref:ClC family H(+)/Cl(-) exchange transporter n=1 Tax=Gordonia phosphorivorans TaxID=1056982 RepID=A0ABV6H9I3_9ACTN
MRTEQPDEPAGDAGLPGPRTLYYLTALAVIAGILAGFVGGAFRWVLVEADVLRTELADWAHAHGPWAWLIPVVVSTVAAAAATWIGSRWPMSAGSGIQQVEATERDEDRAAPATTIPARFVGGSLAIGAGGLVLGREGPTVHIGAAFGTLVGRLGRVTLDEIRVLQSCLAGAGLGVAFNAPIGGAVFVAEELSHKIRLRYLVWTIAAVAAAITCSRVVLGNHPDFAVAKVAEPAVSTLPLFVIFGVFIGALGVAYSTLVVRLRAAFHGFTPLPPVAKGALIGALVGVCLVFLPDAVGGGDVVAQRMLDGQQMAFWTVALYLVLRFCTGPLSYAAGTPGGLFAPMLALGTLCGVFFTQIVEFAGISVDDDTRIALLMAGMAGLFAAVVRAPFTGIVLVMEMCALTTVSISLLTTALGAVIVAAALRSAPVYDSLREQMLAEEAARRLAKD